ncbi:SUMF1/EgtB/PvdO family nonheme iron enzyme [Azohydromonas sediminis]|uniref:SUMF1/EgtB/PvdO family nonheme iron enzyme n=1 Tax=Azohydromonas sediminis TaxID=2259674 RepID=UPI000E64C248|nr:SUMF1/EgtB/PvdO family nonheme iron enzyme [Azohydromonas sediminis]
MAAPGADDPVTVLRHGSAQALSLALMRARNRTLQWLAAFEDAGALRLVEVDRFSPPAWLGGHAGWFQEWWIARHVQRGRGDAADAQSLRLASIEPDADRWWHPQASTRAERWAMDLPLDEALRAWLMATFETTLELLAQTPDGDDALFVFRAALWHEHTLGEAFAELAQALDLTPAVLGGLWPEPPQRAARAAVALPARRWTLGSGRGGFVPELEKWAHEVALPATEIDAQPVSWAQYAEFVDDGGYDERRWWSDAGWAWLRAHVHEHGPRLPRYVEQMRRGVLLRDRGRVVHAAATQPVRHVTFHEAQAWCRWAGRRLPTEAEWEHAACAAASRGFAWGDVWEWVADRAQPYPGYTPGALARPQPAVAQAVLRGASWLTAPALRHPKARRFADPARDQGFCGFRSCAL